MSAPEKRKIVDVRDLLGLAGAGMVFYGCWLVYVPSAFIVTGVLLLAAAIISARR